MRRLILSLVFGFTLTLLQPTALAFAESGLQTDVITQKLVISEIMTTGCPDYDEANTICPSEDGREEFVELYNPSTEPVYFEGWNVEYISSSGKTVTPLAVMNGWVMAESYVLLAYNGYDFIDTDADFYFEHKNNQESGVLASSGGHVRLVDGDNNIVDLVGWGSAEATEDWHKLPLIPAGFSIKRILPGDPLYGVNQLFVFSPPSWPTTPAGGGFLPDDQEGDETEGPGDNPGGTPTTPTPDISCEGVIISEVLPNPAGADAGKEFIELHNPTDDYIWMTGCSIQLASNEKTYDFGAVELAPNQYRAFYDSTTGLVLPNAAGGTLYLLSASDEEIHTVSYPASMADDTAWAWFGGTTWEATYSPTPNKINISQPTKPCPTGQLRNEDTNRCINIVSDSSSLVPCLPHQERNPETNRCRSVVLAATSLAPCGPGQERNPATNRCRSVVSASSSLVPCKPNQERNPATNRCRAVTSASSLKPCAAGQERNPETNRCRKAGAAGGNVASAVKDVETITEPTPYSWFVAGAALLFAIGYGVWEWRKDISNTIAKIRKKLPFVTR